MRVLVLLFATIIFFCPSARAEQAYSAGAAGTPGLLNVPNARMWEPGTAVLHTGATGPYFHGVLGLQIARPLYIGLRQTAQSSSLRGQAERLYPGIDLKLRLLEESAHLPDITVGLQSAFGHRRMGGEYIAATKRFGDFDVTGGVGWGRFGSGHIGNPLKVFGGHFGKNRNPEDEMPSDAGDWFTGSDIGLFGGVEYFPPGQHFSIKAEWGGDRFDAERAAFGYDAPAPWAAGLAFHPAPWIDMNFGLAGAEKITGSITLRPQMKKWPWHRVARQAAEPVHPYRTGFAAPGKMETSAAKEFINLYATRTNDAEASAMMELSRDNETFPFQLGRAARHMANEGGETVEKITVTPTYLGLHGPAISLMRRDLEQALARGQGSPQEIWRGASFDSAPPDRIAYMPVADTKYPRIVLDAQTSLSEEDSGILHRLSLIVDGVRGLGRHFLAGGATRININDNLQRLEKIRPLAPLPVRSDIDRFTMQALGLDRAYLGWMHTPKTDLHVALAAGYLEEMYAGAGGEVLYRPFGKTFALGADAWLALRRDPYTRANVGLNGDHVLTGHLNAWYEIPETDLILHGRIGRYLAEDIGATLSLEKRLDNGVTFSAFATATDAADFDLFGGTTHIYSGLRLNVPIGGFKELFGGSEARITAAPFGRDTGQSIDSPLPLYDLTERFSMRHIAAHWNDVTE